MGSYFYKTNLKRETEMKMEMEMEMGMGIKMETSEERVKNNQFKQNILINKMKLKWLESKQWLYQDIDNVKKELDLILQKLLKKQNQSNLQMGKLKTKNLLKFYNIQGELTRNLFSLINENSNNINNLIFENQENEKSKLINNLNDIGFKSYNKCINLLKESNTISVKKRGQVHFQFAIFNDLLLRKFLDENTKEIETKNSNILLKKKYFAKNVMTNLLISMSYSNSNAVDRFPRVLELLAENNEDQEIINLFENEMKKLPLWLILRWKSQMFATLNSKEGIYILPILVKLARAYPQALYYPYKISQESYSANTKDKIEELDGLLNNNVINKFISHLELLLDPHLRFKDSMEEIEVLIESYYQRGNSIQTQQKEKLKKSIEEGFQTLFRELFNGDYPQLGEWNKQFATGKHKEDFLKHFGAKGEKIKTKRQFKKFKSMLSNNMNSQFREKMKTEGEKFPMTDYSYWLSEYQQISQNYNGFSIEIPGQYDGNFQESKKPNPDDHIKILNFDQELLTMSSMRLPKRIIIHGNDEIEYPFLVKGGEDLRLDQRIEQLFEVINYLMIADPKCSQRRLSIKSYKVIPFTTKVGIIEWLQNTKPFKNVLTDVLKKFSNNDESHHLLFTNCHTKYMEWLNKFQTFGKKSSLMNKYLKMYQSASKSDVIENFQAIERDIPWYLFRQALMFMSNSPETFLQVRNNFAKTLSTFSISSYILGIGDRHLSNFLLDCSDGSVIGIDFGYSFGTATQVLSLPEMVPFRLTRQMIGTLQPLGYKGLLESNMINTFRALKENQDVLLNVMDIFLKEPLLDWQKFAGMLEKRIGTVKKTEKDSTKMEWFPTKKIEIAKTKFFEHPRKVFLQEIRNSIHVGKPYFNALEEIITGGSDLQQATSINQQVEFLIDHATDPNILGRFWKGWQPWV
eukprot:Anaeramoba_flamelloidesa325894_113.p1 GENE.a325894_113~~a325894_113.p1  ORF type:complete len:915 (+),score=279.52 a325894_113:361-3105(+)